MNKIKNIFILWLIKKLGGVPVDFLYVGEKGKKQIHASSYLHFNPIKDEFIIDWTNKNIILTTRNIKTWEVLTGIRDANPPQ